MASQSTQGKDISDAALSLIANLDPHLRAGHTLENLTGSGRVPLPPDISSQVF